MDIAIAPLLRETWWFRLGAVAAFAAALAVLVRRASFRRLRGRLAALEQQAALDRERARIARDIHDDVGNRLTTITLLGDLTWRDRAQPDRVGEHASAITSAARQVIDSLDDIVWAVNPRHDTLPDLVSRIGRFAVEFLGTAGIPHRLELPDHPPERAISAEIRHNLFLAVKEAITNVVRHAQATEVHLAVTVTGEALRVTISDDGRGFSPALDDPPADGLRNLRQRMGDVGGEMHIGSAPGGGTRVSLVLPWRPEGRP